MVNALEAGKIEHRRQYYHHIQWRMSNLSVYLAVFSSSFIAATLLPAQSELVLGGFLASGHYPFWLLISIASVGNILGSLVNWGLGRYFHHLHKRRWFPIKQPALKKAENWYAKYGRWSLLLSWAPFVGDPITLVAGVLREPLWSFLILVTIAKTCRYLVVAAISLSWFS